VAVQVEAQAQAALVLLIKVEQVAQVVALAELVAAVVAVHLQ
jgi:hypothetical protein